VQSTLNSLQDRVLRLVATVGGWTLTGGGALAGVHLGHRITEDLDLFLYGARAFDREPRAVEDALVADGLEVATLQRSPGFVRLAVDDAHVHARVVVDLVAEPVPRVDEPLELRPGLWVDSPYEILVNKLGALLSRSELRDLEDVRALVASGVDLDRALRDVSRKDGGFSPMTLAWVIEQLDLSRAAALGFDPQALAECRDGLLRRLAAEV
jgi:Nucleotidyl transferase AbiEii toxin, Type IV TA system